jgi:hypothetical protein
LPLRARANGPERAAHPVRAKLTRVDLDAGSLIAGFVVSGVGFVFMSYGRKMGRPIHLITGIILMVYPYFIPTVWVMLVIGALLCALNYFAVKRGI